MQRPPRERNRPERWEDLQHRAAAGKLGSVNRVPFNPYDFFGYLASGLVAVVGLEITLGFPPVLGQELHLVDTALLILGVYVAGQVIATPAKALLEDLIVGKILSPPSLNLLRDKKPTVRSLVFPGFYRQLPGPIRQRLLRRAKQEGIQESGEALFLHVRFHDAILKNDKLIAHLESFRNTYGFCRNLSFTCLLLAMICLTGFTARTDASLQRSGVIALLVGILLFYRYLKFFRQYSYELFNTYAQQQDSGANV